MGKLGGNKNTNHSLTEHFKRPVSFSVIQEVHFTNRKNTDHAPSLTKLRTFTFSFHIMYPITNQKEGRGGGNTDFSLCFSDGVMITWIFAVLMLLIIHVEIIKYKLSECEDHSSKKSKFPGNVVKFSAISYVFLYPKKVKFPSK